MTSLSRQGWFDRYGLSQAAFHAGIATLPSHESKTILVVEDQESMRHYLSAVLRSEGYTCEPVSEALAALSRLAATDKPVDLVLSDINMPGLDGIEFLRRIAGPKTGAAKKEGRDLSRPSRLASPPRVERGGGFVIKSRDAEAPAPADSFRESREPSLRSSASNSRSKPRSAEPSG